MKSRISETAESTELPNQKESKRLEKRRSTSTWEYWKWTPLNN